VTFIHPYPLKLKIQKIVLMSIAIYGATGEGGAVTCGFATSTPESQVLVSGDKVLKDSQPWELTLYSVCPTALPDVPGIS